MSCSGAKGYASVLADGLGRGAATRNISVWANKHHALALRHVGRCLSEEFIGEENNGYPAPARSVKVRRGFSRAPPHNSGPAGLAQFVVETPATRQLRILQPPARASSGCQGSVRVGEFEHSCCAAKFRLNGGSCQDPRCEASQHSASHASASPECGGHPNHTRDHASGGVPPLRLIAVEQLLRRLGGVQAVDHGQLPEQIVGILNTGVEALPAYRAVDVGCVPCEEDPALAVVVGQPMTQIEL